MSNGGINISKLIGYTPVEDGPWYRIGAGDKRVDQIGQQIGVLFLKHSPGYEIVMHMQSGKVDTFAPLQLLLELQSKEPSQ